MYLGIEYLYLCQIRKKLVKAFLVFKAYLGYYYTRGNCDATLEGWRTQPGLLYKYSQQVQFPLEGLFHYSTNMKNPKNLMNISLSAHNRSFWY